MAQEIYHAVVKACNRCAVACEHCTSACLKEDAVQHLTRCMELNMDCSLLCVVTAKFLARNSAQGPLIARQCAEACRACAEECRKHEMRHCQECATACEECAGECEKVAVQFVV